MLQYDVIVVGLGCAGISTAYFCAKNGMNVLGIEMFSQPGSFGSSSFGETRQWSVIYSDKLKNRMMKSAVELWREIEQEGGEKLIYSLSFLCIGTEQNKYFKDMLDSFPEMKILNSDEICDKYPALKNIPDDYKGILTMDGGIVQAKTALRVCRELAEIKYGANLLFDTKVTKFAKNQVETDDGKIYTAKHVVMASDNHFNKNLGYAVVSDGSGLPGGFLECDHNNQEYYGMVDGDKLEGYKMGICGQGDKDKITEYFL